MSPPPALPPDSTNRVADDPRAAALGRALFFDAGLSRSGTLACANCHVPAHAFTDGRARAVGSQPEHIGRRNTPSLWWSAYQRWQTWGGAADSLWAQPALAWENPLEHALSRAELATRVVARHGTAYTAVFGPHGRNAEEIAANAGKAVAAYLRTIAPGESPFDRWVAGHSNAMTPQAVRGLAVFMRVGCIRCHSGPLFSDDMFHAARFPDDPAVGPDTGRYEDAAKARASTQRCDGPYSDDRDERMPPEAATSEDRGRFHTPSLRGVALTAPYGHAGTIPTLELVVDLYAQGGAADAQITGGERRDPFLEPFEATNAEREALVAFLRALTPDRGPTASAPMPNGAM
jgi:cytochrome c peroxidase